MVPVVRALAPVLFVAFCAAWPTRAAAWANAQVASAQADVTLEPDGGLHARMTFRVRVLSGWLTELEIAGLDPGLEADVAAPPTFALADGTPVEFSAVAERSGRFAFTFPRNRSPRAGEYVATVSYAATHEPVSSDAERVRFRWTFPGWAASLDDVRLRFTVPEAATVVAEEDAAVTRTDRTDGATTVVELHRLHLPRSVPWSVDVDFPRALVPVALAPAVTPPPPQRAVVTSRDGRPQPAMHYVTLVFALVALCKRIGFERRARSRGATPRPLVPLPAAVAVVAMIACAATAFVFWAHRPELAFAALTAVFLLTVQRTAARRQSARLGAFHPAALVDRRNARWEGFVSVFAPDALLDATRPLGLVTVLAIVFALARVHAADPVDSRDAVFTVPHALFLLFLLGFVGGKRMLPSTVGERLLLLESVASNLRVPSGHGEGFAFNFSLHRDAAGTPQDARLRFFMDHRANGLVRLDIAVVERPTLGGYVTLPVVLCVVRQGTEAERILAGSAQASTVRAAPGGRRARILPLGPSTFALLDRLALPTAPPASPRISRSEARAALPTVSARAL